MKKNLNEKEFEEEVTTMIIDYLKEHDAKEIHRLILAWNFDNFSEVIQWVANCPKTDKATALQLYWLMEPGYSKQFKNRMEVVETGNSWYLSDFDTIETIEKNYIEGFYEIQEFYCDPNNDHWGIDRVKDSLYEEAKNEIPKIMMQPLTGVKIDEPKGWDDGIPKSLQTNYEALANQLME